MSHRFAFVGFRHPHIFDMYRRCQSHAAIDVVACCEEHAESREQLSTDGEVSVTHHDFQSLLDADICDVVAVGDSYGLRARRVLAALEAGKHVISDKPMCLAEAELVEIQALAARQGRVVGCMLDMRDLPVYAGMREQLRAGRIGDVHAISFEGQHPLLFGKRPSWYFEPGMHGGVFNDIAIHAVDILPWMTGHGIGDVVAARAWNATLPQFPQFQQCGQLMLKLANGAGVIGDVSYLLPDSFGYTFPLYWRFVFWGTDGVLEGGVNSPQLALYRNGPTEVERVDLPAGRPGGYLESFLQQIEGAKADLHLSAREVVQASKSALEIQRVADSG